MPTDNPVRYKRSQFNAFTTTAEGVFVLYNSYTGRQCALREPAATLVREYLTSPQNGPLDKLGSYLLDNGYIVNSDIDEMANWDVRFGYLNFRPDILVLTLLASEDCNFRCTYCGQAFKRGTMTPDVREGIRAFITKRIRRLNWMALSWFGGEPLMGWDAIEDLAPFFKKVVAVLARIRKRGFLITRRFSDCLTSGRESGAKRRGLWIRDIANTQAGAVGV